MGWIISAIIASAIAIVIYYIIYLTLVKGFVVPIHIFHSFKGLYERYGRNKRLKERMYEYEAVSGMHKPSLFGSSVVVSILTVIIVILLFKIVFFAVVTSDSMSPTFERGDLILMQRIHIDPRVGDIIMLENRESILPITHRVVAVTKEGVRTKGDARAFADPWLVSKHEIRGEAVQIHGSPIILKAIGNYFILNPKEMGIGRYGSEYMFIKNLFLVIRMYGYALCIISISGYLLLTVMERRR
ncbi:signal peptidase I [Methanosarcinales archaeon]|nr:MAG: signal peptidase I [Methanosarcinales archaeon]